MAQGEVSVPGFESALVVHMSYTTVGTLPPSVGGLPASVLVGLPQTLACPPPPQVCGDVHVPQLNVPPHPSPAGPQLKASPAHVFGTHALPSPCQHTLDTQPPPHISGAVHVPHCSAPPHPSPAGPQLIPCAEHVSGTQDGPVSGVASRP